MSASNPHRRPALLVRVLGVSLALVFGCSGATTSPRAAAIASARVQSQNSLHRPRLTLVEREGDPRRGVALAVHVAGTPVSAAALSVLVHGRLSGAGFEDAAVQASPSGFLVYTLVDDARQLAHFIHEGNRALVTPLGPTDAERVSARLAADPPRVARSASEAAVAQCSGELLLEPAAHAVSAVAQQLGRWLDSVRVGDTAFAVVGSREHLEAAAAAVSGLAAWSRRGSAGWYGPERDRAGMDTASKGQLSLSVALSGAPAAKALAAVERLGEPESLLSVRLAAGFPPWQVARISSHLEAGAACLRVDLEAGGVTPPLETMAESAWSAVDELEHVLQRLEPGPWVVAKQVLAAEAPHEAAAIAAWQALNVVEASQTSRPRRLVHYAGALSTPGSPERFAELLEASRDAAPPGPERVNAAEPGQGKFWMLIATPCGTSAEDAATAGTLALALHSVAAGFSGRSGVVLEPWMNVDAMGILAHAAAGAPHESPNAQAERVAEALARALLSQGPRPDVVAASRLTLLDGLADGPTPGLSLALRQMSADHPSWLDARGTWSTLAVVSPRSVELARENFLRGKLRLASLGNHDDAQVAAGERRLLSLLRAADAGRGACVPRRPALPISGKYRVEAAESRDSEAIIAVPLPAADGLSDEVLWTEFLLNRTDGWLSQALLTPGLVGTARARALGGVGAAALVIELHAADGRRDEAVAQVRGLLEQLRAGAANAADAALAAESLARRRAELSLNPRSRVVHLWRGRQARARSAATLDSLRALHRAAFEAGREVVVFTDPP